VLTCVFAVFLSEAHPGVADGPPQGPGRSAHRCFCKKLLLSGIIYGIPDSRLRIVVDELIQRGSMIFITNEPFLCGYMLFLNFSAITCIIKV
jgi:hypothetical protein